MDRRQSIKLLRQLTGAPDQNSQKDLLFKMSKKIAQLTKIVYFLNTRNEDFEKELKNLKVFHKAEIVKIEGDGKVVVAELNRKLAEAIHCSAVKDIVIKVLNALIGSIIWMLLSDMRRRLKKTGWLWTRLKKSIVIFNPEPRKML
jgi:hypothetical protein